MSIDYAKMDEYKLSANDILHVTIDSKDTNLLEALRQDLTTRFPFIRGKFVITTSGIQMKKFTKDELKLVRNDLNRIIGDECKEDKVVEKSIQKPKSNKSSLTAFRIRNKATGTFEKSGTGKTIWLRKPNLKSMYLNESRYEIIEFDLIERL